MRPSTTFDNISLNRSTQRPASWAASCSSSHSLSHGNSSFIARIARSVSALPLGLPKAAEEG